MVPHETSMLVTILACKEYHVLENSLDIPLYDDGLLVVEGQLLRETHARYVQLGGHDSLEDIDDDVGLLSEFDSLV